MKKVKNKSFTGVAISLQGGRTLTLAARGSAEISDADFENPEIQRMFKARSIIVLSESAESPKAASEPAPEAAASSEPKAKPEGAGTEKKGRGPAKVTET